MTWTFDFTDRPTSPSFPDDYDDPVDTEEELAKMVLDAQRVILNGVFARAPSQGIPAIDYVSEYFDTTLQYARAICDQLIPTIAYRLGHKWAMPHRLWKAGLTLFAMGAWGDYKAKVETPEFLVYIIQVKTGFESYDLEVEVDAFVSQVGKLLDIAGYITWYRLESLEREEHYAWIKTSVVIVMVSIALAGIFTPAFAAAELSYSSAIAKEMSTISAISEGIDAFITVAGVTVSSFLTAIHYDAILSVHNIAYLVSEDYRVLMSRIFTQISSVSSALGLGSYFLIHAIQNTRSLVLSASSLMGKKYDLAEVVWLSTLREYMVVFNTRAYRYKNNPGAVLYDLEQLVEKDAVNIQAISIRSIFETVKSVANIIDTQVKEIVKVRDDLDHLVADLPDVIRKQIKPYTDKITERFSDFYIRVYDPAMKEFNSIIAGLNKTQTINTSNMNDIVNRLKRPADYLLEIDNLEEWDRIDQERKISEISGRPFRSDVDVIDAHAEPTKTELERIRRALEYVSIEPLYLPSEVEGPGRPAGVPAKERETWFIGDY